MTLLEVLSLTAPAIPTSAVESAFQNPVVYALLLVLIVLYLLSEVTGFLKGPINKVITRRRVAAAEAAPDLLALQRAVASLESNSARDAVEIQKLRREVDELRRDRDASNVVLAAHIPWDRAAQVALAHEGIDLPAPPPLYVYDSEETP